MQSVKLTHPAILARRGAGDAAVLRNQQV